MRAYILRCWVPDGTEAKLRVFSTLSGALQAGGEFIKRYPRDTYEAARFEVEDPIIEH